MQVNQANAAAVANLFTKLSDERFTMRSVNAIKKGTEQTTAQVLTLAAEIGCPVRKRAEDDKLFVQRPMTVAQAQEIVNKADAVLAGTQEPFDLDLNPVVSSDLLPEDEDLIGQIEGDLSDRTLN